MKESVKWQQCRGPALLKQSCGRRSGVRNALLLRSLARLFLGESIEIAASIRSALPGIPARAGPGRATAGKPARTEADWKGGATSAAVAAKRRGWRNSRLPNKKTHHFSLVTY